MGQPQALIRLFSVFSNKQYNLYKNQCEKCHVHLVYGAGIQTHHLSNMSRLPLPLDQLHGILLLMTFPPHQRLYLRMGSATGRRRLDDHSLRHREVGGQADSVGHLRKDEWGHDSLSRHRTHSRLKWLNDT